MAKKQVAKGQETQAELPPLPRLTAPKLLPWWKAWGLTLLLPMCLASFVASIVGLYVLTGKPRGADVASMPFLHLNAEHLFADQQNDKWISRSLFGQSYKILVSTNAAWSPFFFNGGLVGFVYCCIQLHRHRKALQVGNSSNLPPGSIKPNVPPQAGTGIEQMSQCRADAPLPTKGADRASTTEHRQWGQKAKVAGLVFVAQRLAKCFG